MQIVMYGVGSSILVDVAETCARLKIEVAAWIKNIEAAVFAPTDANLIAVGDIGGELTKHAFLVPIFTPGRRRDALYDAVSHGFSRPFTLIDPTAVIASTSSIEQGSYLGSLSNIGAASRLSRFVFVNRSASIGHHSELAEFVSIGPGAVLAAGVRAQPGSVIGAGAVVLPGIEIGANAVVGAGANVTKNVPANSLVVGNPAKVTKSGILGYNGCGV